MNFFLDNGYIVIKNAFTKEKAAEWTRDVWVRLGMDPNDKPTWNSERIHMPWFRRETVATFAPNVRQIKFRVSNPLQLIDSLIHSQAWAAIKDLLGGEERINEDASQWGDSFIVNLGTEHWEKTEPLPPQDLDNWHVDGDFFVSVLVLSKSMVQFTKSHRFIILILLSKPCWSFLSIPISNQWVAGP